MADKTAQAVNVNAAVRAIRARPGSLLRKHLKCAEISRTIKKEVAPVKCENSAKAMAFGRNYQAGVGKIHRQAGVLSHQRSDPGKIVHADINNLNGGAKDKIPQEIACRGFIKKVKGFSQDRPGRYQITAKLPKGVPALGVRTVEAVGQRHQRAGITECLLDAWQAASPLRCA